MSNPVLTNAEAAVKQLQSWTDLPLDYSRDSLEAVEDLLETASHQALNEQTQAALRENVLVRAGGAHASHATPH